MHLRMTLFAAAAALALASTAQAADVLTYNGTPAAGWYYGTGNNYAPANSEVLTTDAGDQLALRFHKTYQTAPASAGKVYQFALGTTPISFDWLIDPSSTGSFTSALLSLTNLGTGATFSYDPFFVGNDNSSQNGSFENSYRLNWAPIGFNPAVDDTYKVNLTVNGLSGGSKSVSALAQLGAGAAVPEPATWALMILGIGGVGALLRRKRDQVRTGKQALIAA